ncbi:MAG: hypothetical protein JRG94_19155, partial [Deltaproteobacteria bacterium]|nr:hypothetical protein [Deltaproteobacteria bacterium]
MTSQEAPSIDREGHVSPRVVAALVLAGVTGACGLAYEVAWQKYLAVLLGAQSEASAAILALFLGGLSGGYALFGRVAQHTVMRAGEARAPARLLRIYAACEIAIGLLALSFP